MRVEILYTDSTGTYRVCADVRPNNRTVHIIEISDNEYAGEIDPDDFSADEMGEIHSLILAEYDELDKDNSDGYSVTDDEENEDELPADY